MLKKTFLILGLLFHFVSITSFNFQPKLNCRCLYSIFIIIANPKSVIFKSYGKETL